MALHRRLVLFLATFLVRLSLSLLVTVPTPILSVYVYVYVLIFDSGEYMYTW